MCDMRLIKDTVKNVVAELRAEDHNWSWKADVLKNEIRVWWGYLQYCDRKDSHFTIKMSAAEDDFITANDEHDEFVSGAIIGSESWCDGNLAECVTKLLRNLADMAHRCY